jgi:5'-nucleotidase
MSALPYCPETFFGRSFNLLNPQSGDVDLRDIAHSLARQTRFTGHTAHHYSVAEHCLWTWKLIERLFPAEYMLQLYAQLHDAHEAYTGDISGPMKAALRIIGPSPLDAIEANVQRAVIDHFRLPAMRVIWPGMIKHADLIMRETERQCPALLPHSRDENWTPIDGIAADQGILDGTLMLEPAKMIPEAEWDGMFPAQVRFPARVALTQPSDHPVYRPVSKPLFEDDVARLFRYNAERLLALTEKQWA